MRSFYQTICDLLDLCTTSSGRKQLAAARPGSGQQELSGDGFIIHLDDPLAEAHYRISALLQEHLVEGQWFYAAMNLKDTPTGHDIASMSPDATLIHLRALLVRIVTLEAKKRHFEDTARDHISLWNPHLRAGWERIGPPSDCLNRVVMSLMRRKLPYTHDDLLAFGHWLLAARDGTDHTCSAQLILSPWNYPLAGIVKALSIYVNDPHPEAAVIECFQRVAAKLKRFAIKETAHFGYKIDQIIGTGDKISIPVTRGEAWSDQALDDIDAMPPDDQQAWAHLLSHARTASGGKPSATWLKTARTALEAVGLDAFTSHILTWFPLVDKPRSQPIQNRYAWNQPAELMISDPHMDVLKGLAWMCASITAPEVARSLTALAISAYRKVPGFGPRAVRVGNACVYALGAMPGVDGVAQLAILKTRVKVGTALQSIEKALVTTAERVGIARSELEEMAVPTYGLGDVGHQRVDLGEYTAELQVHGSKVTLHWIKPDGKPQKSVPKGVKDTHPEALKELKQRAKDIERLVPVQSARIEQLYLQQRQWALHTWQPRYIDHALVGSAARRIIWTFANGDQQASAMYHHGKFVTHADEPIDWLTDETTVSIWHPIDAKEADIVAWREWLVRHEVRQPFKQAHREIYLLTDAERHTGVYSNRFASHILKQHQFHALCGARGWKNQLRLMVDDDSQPARIELPQWGLRAEYWIQGLGEDYGADTNETGTFYYIATDQVRFYRTGAAPNWGHAGGGSYYTAGTDREENHPVPLEEIPPLVLSEVMRDVDLFVGVASVGNDPHWADGGPEGRFVNYWQNYSFGDLGATAQTRKAVLERLIPRLKIADRCSFTERFLVVRGDIRTYKIHLGSGNILMEPSDRYLCIVLKPSSTKDDGNVFLPFEGDTKTSIILSKVFLLADDTKIKDRTILSQIKL